MGIYDGMYWLGWTLDDVLPFREETYSKGNEKFELNLEHVFSFKY